MGNELVRYLKRRWCEVHLNAHDQFGGAARKRASAMCWTLVGLLSLFLAGSVASDSRPVELEVWVGRFIGAACALLLCVWGLHKVTCWLLDAFAKVSDP